MTSTRKHAEELARKQVGGDHYAKHKIQPFDIIDDYGLDFYEGNALKYLLRHRDKNGKEDLEKLRDYVDQIIKRHYPDLKSAVTINPSNGA